ncbi:MAG: alcohol dehydrogenase catalytic domain-containing protein [Candidatus Hadarchaeota archaeon]
MTEIPDEMRALVRSDHGVNLETVKTPYVGDSEALIRVEKAGICGTDLAIYRGDFEVPTPIIMGHEFSGQVVQGSDDWIGRRVTSEINITCGECDFCAAGKPNHCVDREALGISTDGCFAEYVKVPEENLHGMSLSFETATFVEPLAAAIRILELTEIDEEDDVLIVGCGRLGLLILQVMRLKGVNVYVSDRDEDKLKIASSWGAKPILLEDPPFRFDVVVDSAGSPSVLDRELDLVKPMGTVALKSTPGVPSKVDASKIPRKEITIQGSRCGPFERAIDMLESGKVEVDELITGRFSLENYREAFESIKIKHIFDISSM